MQTLVAPPQLLVYEPMNRTIRPLVAADRSGVFRILENAGNFTPEEVATALELIDEWLELGEHSGYLTYVLETQSEESTEVLGYVCFGPTPLTESTYDLYWIAVDKSKHRGGVGKKLMKFTEEEIARRGGRLLLIETSSQETYGGTIQFYERTGYELVGKIKEYYKPGDDKLIFVKRLQAPVAATASEAERRSGAAQISAPDSAVGVD
jgi:ribosomal protein S18 acetylase RimI-like enzyme